jgi:hypothetical protein
MTKLIRTKKIKENNEIAMKINYITDYYTTYAFK